MHSAVRGTGCRSRDPLVVCFGCAATVGVGVRWRVVRLALKNKNRNPFWGPRFRFLGGGWSAEHKILLRYDVLAVFSRDGRRSLRQQALACWYSVHFQTQGGGLIGACFVYRSLQARPREERHIIPCNEARPALVKFMAISFSLRAL